MPAILKEDGFSLVLRGKTYSIEYYSPEKGFTTRQSLGVSDLELARDQFRIKKARLTKGPTTLEQLQETEIVELYSRQYLNVWEKLPSKYVYKRGLELVTTYLDGVLVKDFVVERQDEFIQAIRENEGLEESYIARLVSSVGTAIKTAYQSKSLTGWPWVKPVKVPQKNERPHILTDEEARVLIEAAKKDENAWRYVQIAFQTAARPQAIIDLEKDQFLLDRGLIDLLPKGQAQNEKKRRPTLPLTTSLLSACEGWNDGAIFVVHSDHQRKGKKLRSYRGIQDYLRPYFPKGCSLYTIRRTVATKLMDEGVPGDQISIWLGHQPQGIAKVSLLYAQMRKETLARALKVIEGYWESVNGRAAANGSRDARDDSQGLPQGGKADGVLDWVWNET